MMKRDKSTKDITFSRIKNLQLDEPSVDFTKKVMELVTMETSPQKNQQKKYWWILILVPVVAAVSWYLISLFNLDGYLVPFSKSLQNLIQLITIRANACVDQIKGINISSMVLFGFLAIIALLSIDEYIGRMKNMSHESQGASL